MSKNLNIIFSENLRRLLAEHDKTQADLYRYMGVSSAIASAWCAGKKIPRGDKLQKMCIWFNCDLSDLLEEKPVEVIKPIENTKEDKTVQKILKSLDENPENRQFYEDIINLDDEKKQALARLMKYMSD